MFKRLKQMKKDRINFYKGNKELKKYARKFIEKIVDVGWGFNSVWLGVPLFQTPIDLYAFQEIIWKVKPDLIIEAGVKFGGSLIFSASMLVILETCGYIKNGRVIGIDVRLPPKDPLSYHSNMLSKKITVLHGSSTDPKIVNKIKEIAKGKKVMVFLDSSHNKQHVLNELNIYSKLVSVGSYIVVEDTQLEELPPKIRGPYGEGNNPRRAVWEFMKDNDNFVIDKEMENRILFLAYIDGYLRRIK